MPDIARTTTGDLPGTEVHPHYAPSAEGPPAVPGYEILEEVGRGGMGVVYRARDLKLGRLVALKMLPAGLADADLLNRFQTEAAAIARLQHPNIVQIFEVGEVAGRPFLTLEFVPGGTLAKQLARTPQPIQVAADLTRTLALAIEHAHQQGVLHRDLKPGNVLLSAECGMRSAESNSNALRTPHSALRTAKIADFGLAKRLEQPDGPTKVGDILGTPSYMAPEQATGVTQMIGPAVDIYALGAILYEMLTGRPPFLGESAAQTVVQVLSQDPVSIRQLRPDCPRNLETICQKCLEKKPTKRYVSATALAEDLRRFLAGESIVARRADPFERTAKWAKRNPAGAATLATGLVSLLIVSSGGIAYSFQLRKHNTELKELAQREHDARERSQANFQKARQTVKDLLAEVATKDLASVPYMDPVRRSLLGKAKASLEEFLLQDRDDPAVKRDIAQVTGDMGEIAEMLGDKAGAERYLNDAIQLHQELADAFSAEPDHRNDLADATMKLGNLLTDSGRQSEAIPLFDRALDLWSRFARTPGPAGLPLRACRLFINRGRVFATTRKMREAEKAFAQARDEALALVRGHPETPSYRETLAACYNNLGKALYDQGHLPESAAAYERGVELLRVLADAEPDKRTHRHHLAIYARNLANAFWWQTPHDDPKTQATLVEQTGTNYRLSVTAFRRLVHDYPHIPDYRHGLAISLEALGEYMDYNKQPEGRLLFDEAIRFKSQLIEEQPRNADFLTSLGMSYALLAASHRRRHEWSEAAGWEVREIEQTRAALAVLPQHPRYRGFLRAAVFHHGETLLHLKDHAGAVAAARESAALVPENAEAAFESAGLLAKCVPLAADPKLRESYAAAAVLLSRRAIDQGLAPKTIGEAKELDPLRQRPDFPQLPPANGK